MPSPFFEELEMVAGNANRTMLPGVDQKGTVVQSGDGVFEDDVFEDDVFEGSGSSSTVSQQRVMLAGNREN